jgi:long-chain acyl-CoA synthetase
MEKKPWHGPHWPEDVPWEISGYQKPLFSILDEAACESPDHVYTIFNGATQTFLQVKAAADRIARFLSPKTAKETA